MLWKVTATLVWAKILNPRIDLKPIQIKDAIKVCIPVEAHNFGDVKQKAELMLYETFGARLGYEGPGIKFELFEVVSY